ncbi:MAG: zinc-ribbon domain-containing protein [Methanobrevibacter sp.]
MVKICPKCHSENKDEAKSCIKCGYTFRDDVPYYHRVQLKSIRCPQCHNVITNLSYGFCPKCGFEFQKKEKNVTYNYLEVIPKSEHENSITFGYIFSVFIPIIGLVYGIYNFTRNGDVEAKKAGINQIIMSVLFLVMDITYFYFLFNMGLFKF